MKEDQLSVIGLLNKNTEMSIFKVLYTTNFRRMKIHLMTSRTSSYSIHFNLSSNKFKLKRK